MSNRERIVEECRRLMNARGAQAIGTTQISDALKISPGNLYYHFKNKEEIVHSLFDDLEFDFRDVFISDVVTPIRPVRFANFYLTSLDVAWKHRFFFGGLLHLLRKDESLALRYRGLQDWALNSLENIARQIVKDGNMSRPRSRNGYRSIAVNTWLIWSNWIHYVQISSENHNISRLDMITGVSQIFDVLSPYLDPEFDRSARRVLAQNLAKGQDEYEMRDE